MVGGRGDRGRRQTEKSHRAVSVFPLHTDACESPSAQFTPGNSWERFARTRHSRARQLTSVTTMSCCCFIMRQSHSWRNTSVNKERHSQPSLLFFYFLPPEKNHHHYALRQNSSPNIGRRKMYTVSGIKQWINKQWREVELMDLLHKLPTFKGCLWNHCFFLVTSVIAEILVFTYFLSWTWF